MATTFESKSQASSAMQISKQLPGRKVFFRARPSRESGQAQDLGPHPKRKKGDVKLTGFSENFESRQA